MRMGIRENTLRVMMEAGAVRSASQPSGGKMGFGDSLGLCRQPLDACALAP